MGRIESRIDPSGGGSSGLSIGSTVIVGGTDTRVLFNDGGVLGEDSAFTWDKTNDLLTISKIKITQRLSDASGGPVLDFTDPSAINCKHIWDYNGRTYYVGAGSSGTVNPFLGAFFDKMGLGYANGDAIPTLTVGKIKVKTGANLTLDADRIVIPNSVTPASAAATGVAGTIAWDANFIYVCVATDTWKRIAIITW